MNRRFRVLYDLFLFRMVDLEVLSAHALGDANKLLGQFASLLLFVSVVISFFAVSFDDVTIAPEARFAFTLYMEHFLIATTMLVVGIFAVLSWDSIFPDRRDVLVLMPLPIRARTVFLAKLAATASALSLVVLLFHSAAGLTWPLALDVQAEPHIAPSLTFDPALPPLSASDLKPELDQALKQSIASDWLRPGSGGGLVIGVSKQGERRIFTYGTAKADSLFEIGSISKTFTGLILAQMVVQGKARLDEPVRLLLPPGVGGKPARREISLLDLATHHSGLPRMPDNIETGNPCGVGDYHPDDLYAYVRKRGLEKPPGASFRYSNLGMGLVGQALANLSGTTYPDLLREQITSPLGLRDTVVSLSREQRERFSQGLDAQHHPVHECSLDALAGAGGIRSTAGDMLTYLEANLHPDRFPTLRSALVESHLLRRDAPLGMQIALAWVYRPDDGVYWHSGGTPGFTSEAFFSPKTDSAALVLTNIGPNPLLSSFLISEHIRQRLSGKPAFSLETTLVPASHGVTGLLRWFAAYWITMFAAGAFIYCGVLLLQGAAAQLLPRSVFLRASGLLQTATFCVVVCIYFLEPSFSWPGMLLVPEASSWLVFSPSYWFLGLFHQLNGSMHPALAPLALRAWRGMLIAGFGAAVSFALSYVRTLRQIVEQPEISPGIPGVRLLPSLGSALETAIGHFTLRTLARSRQHRLLLAFYLGIGLAFTIFLLQPLATQSQLLDVPVTAELHQANTPMLAASIMLTVLGAVGARVAFALPLELRANWIFRVIGVRSVAQVRNATRRALFLISVVPIWLGSAAVCFSIWPMWQATSHLLVLSLLGILVTELSLWTFRKIPFACSYLPGKSQVHMIFYAVIAMAWLLAESVRFEQRALQQFSIFVFVILILAMGAVGIRWATALRGEDEIELNFEETPPPVVFELGLHRDGVMPLDTSWNQHAPP